MRNRCIVFVLIVFALAGCRNVFSSDSLTYPIDKEAAAVGLSYALPKAVIRGKLVVDPSTAAFVMCLLAVPVPVADPQQQYYMPYRNSWFSADKYTITKDDVTGRLKQIDVRTIDRFSEFAINIGKSIGAIKAAIAQEGGQAERSMCASAAADYYVLATFDIDPTDERQVRGDMAGVNEVMLRFAERKAAQCSVRRLPKNEVIAEDVIIAEEACREYHRIARTYSARNPAIRMNWVLPHAPQGAKPDCSVGFCYRHTLPHTVQIAMAGSSVHSYTYQLPNASPIVAMDIARAITVTKTTTIDFGDLGQITSIKVLKGKEDGTLGSEAEGLALIPHSVITAYFGAVSTTTDLIGKMFTSEETLLKNKKARDQADIDAHTKHMELEKLRQEGSGGGGEDYAVAASNGLNTTKPKSVKYVIPAAPAKPLNNTGDAAPAVKPKTTAELATDKKKKDAEELAALEKQIEAERDAAEKAASEAAKKPAAPVVGKNPPAVVTPLTQQGAAGGPSGPGGSMKK